MGAGKSSWLPKLFFLNNFLVIAALTKLIPAHYSTAYFEHLTPKITFITEILWGLKRKLAPELVFINHILVIIAITK